MTQITGQTLRPLTLTGEVNFILCKLSFCFQFNLIESLLYVNQVRYIDITIYAMSTYLKYYHLWLKFQILYC